MSDNKQTVTKISITETLYFLEDSQKRKKTEAGMEGHSMGLVMNLNDEVLKNTKIYLDQFTQFKSVDVAKEMRKVAKLHGISTDLCVKIMDLGLRDYDEAVSLYPDLKEYPKEHVEELIEKVKLHSI